MPPELPLNQDPSAVLSLKQNLPNWITQDRDEPAFNEFLRNLGIYEKSEQYLGGIIKHYAELAQKSRIPLSHLVSYVAKYAANNNVQHLQVESTARTAILKLIMSLVKEKHALYDEARKMVFLFDPLSLEYYYFNFEVMLGKYYAGIEEHVERSYPTESTFLPPNKMPRIDIWKDLDWRQYNPANVESLVKNSDLKLCRFIFPDKSVAVVHPEYLPQLLETAKNKILYISNILSAKDPRYFQDLIVFVGRKLPQYHLETASFMALLKEPVQSAVPFWALLTVNLEKYLGPKTKLNSFYQAACLIHAWTLGLAQKQEQEQVRLENQNKLWEKIQSTPIIYTVSDITDLARSIQLDRIYQNDLGIFVTDTIQRFSKAPKDGKGVYLQQLKLDNKDHWVVNNHLADIFMAQLALVKDKYHDYYVNSWKAKFKDKTFKEDPLINDANEYLKDLYLKLKTDENEFYCLAHDQFPLVIKAINGYSNRSKIAEWKKKFFHLGIENSFGAMDTLLDIKHSDLLSEAEAYSPLLRLFPMLKGLFLLFQGGKSAKAKKKKTPSLIKEAMTHVINAGDKPAKNKKKAAPAKPVKEKAPPPPKVDDRKKAIQDKLKEIQASLFGNKNIMDELEHLEKNWNRTIEQNLQLKEEIKKKNKKYVVSIIQHHIKNMKLSVQNVETIAKNICADQQFAPIKDKESLEKYIQGYVILTLQKKHA